MLPNEGMLVADHQANVSITGIRQAAQQVVEKWSADGDHRFGAGISHGNLVAIECYICGHLAHSLAQATRQNYRLGNLVRHYVQSLSMPGVQSLL